MKVPNWFANKVKIIRKKIKLFTVATVLSSLAIVATGSAELNIATNSASPQIEGTSSAQTMITPNETLALIASKNKLEDQSVSSDEEYGVKKDPTGKFLEDRLVIKFKDGVSDNDKKAIVRQFGAKFIREDLDLSGGKVIFIDPAKRAEAENALSVDSRVEYIHTQSLLRSLGGGGFGGSGTTSIGGTYQTGPNCNPNDPKYCNGYQWGLQAIGATAGWGFSRGSNTVTVAVLDTGISTHRDLDSVRIYRGKNYINNTSDVIDDTGHGTSVASIIAARTNNQLDIAAVNWNTKVLVAKVNDKNNSGNVQILAAAIRDVVNNYQSLNVRVINISQTSTNDVDVPELKSAINYAASHDIVVVAGAKYGQNDPLGFTNCFIGFPAAYPTVVSVVALWQAGPSDYRHHSGCTQSVLNGVAYSPPALSAPGSAIQSLLTSNGVDYVVDSAGTSIAAPFVSGVAAVLAACIPNSTHLKIEQALFNTAQNLGPAGYDTTYGFGMVLYGNSIIYNSYYQSCPPN